MNIHEYQGKEILRKYGVTVPKGSVAFSPEEAVKVAKELGSNVTVVKAQIHAGGRGKAGGVKIAKNLDEVRTYAKELLGKILVTHQTGPEGKEVKRLYIEEGSDIKKEYYLSFVLDRATSRVVLMGSEEGGMDIEEVAAHTPHLIFKEEIDPKVGLQPFQARKIAFNLGVSGDAFKEMVKFVSALYKAYDATDSSLFEINPVLKTSDNKVLAVDAKVNIDDNALYRHPDYAAMRDELEEDPTEVEAGKSNLNYVKLDGNVGCMVNGAGLAMATMDIIKLAGGEPANFLDVGGTANAQTVKAGFNIILSDPNVKAILINIFGGIVRCDRVAQGVIDAYHEIGNIPVPIIVRLQGTNAKEAKELIDNSGLKVFSAILLKEAAERVKEVLAKQLAIIIDIRERMLPFLLYIYFKIHIG